MFPLTAWLDNTGECLAVKLRPGNAGANTICDHIDVLAAAIAQLPPAYRRRLLVTVDGAGAPAPTRRGGCLAVRRRPPAQDSVLVNTPDIALDTLKISA